MNIFCPSGKILYRQCADTVKKLSLELGGNAPFIVFESADMVMRPLAGNHFGGGEWGIEIFVYT